ncbi:MAG: DIP1984 family protein [Solobacterium sp.]|nr:DIP1984 family protein [Solobacterium sp.]
MKLAEALQERSDLKIRIAQLRTRLLNNATVQEGESTAEDPNDLLVQLEEASRRLETLIARINLSNSSIQSEGKTLTEWIARKDALTQKLAITRDLINEASALAYRARGSEIKVKSAVNVTELQTQADAMAKELREVNNRIQETNWTNDLI